eukprot:TRINITY_DN4698_c0_g1_i2.p1 TRINITY_DN4698_c0_g1~~TRINITY_DN4698_c0_g1_i2.p1  ORF type:complete len:345 (-),score=75.88 TRINITY_DN4698_c0_g1_i2:1194-2228(-)
MFRREKRNGQLAPPGMPTFLVAVNSSDKESSSSDACHRSIADTQATVQPQDFNIPKNIPHRGSMIDCDVDLYASRRSSTSEKPNDTEAPSIALLTNTGLTSGQQDLPGCFWASLEQRSSSGEYWDTTMSDAEEDIKDAMDDFELKQQPLQQLENHHCDAAGSDEEDIDAMIEEAGSASDDHEFDVARLLQDDILEASHDSRRFSTASRQEKANATRWSVLRRGSGAAACAGDSMVKLEGPLSRGLSYRRTSARGEQETSYIPVLFGKTDARPQHEHGSMHHENHQARETRRAPVDDEPDEVQQYQELVDCLAAAKLDPRSWWTVLQLRSLIRGWCDIVWTMLVC